jgi:ribonuclease D
MEEWLVRDRDLSDEALGRYLEADAVGIDTETMGLVIGRDRLCLVQICDPSGFTTAIRITKGQSEAPNLKTLLEAKNVVKIFHYARFDVAQLRHTFGVNTNPIFCTKIASKLARTYTSSHGLKSLVQSLEGVELDKTSQTSDWGDTDNLSEAQLRYAANDVRYLVSMREKLIKMLQREDRWELAQQCFQVLPVIVSLDLQHFEGIFEHR